MENTNKVGRSKLWTEIYNIVRQIPRKKVYGDAIDAPSASTSIENLYGKYKTEADKPESPAVFWAHFRSSAGEADVIARFKSGAEPHLIFDWITEERKKLEEKTGNAHTMTNCGVIR